MNKKQRDHWLAERKILRSEGKLGSSDSAALLGLSPFKTKAHLQRESLQGIYDEDESQFLKLGLLIEDDVCELYEDRTGIKPEQIDKIIVSKKWPWLFCSLDARVPSNALEIKNVTFPQGKWGEEGTDAIPEPYIIQGQHDLAVLEEEMIEFPVLMFGKLRLYRMKRNETIIDMIANKSKEFYEKHIVRQEPVPLDYEHPKTYDLLRDIPSITGKKIELDKAEADMSELYQKLGKEITELDKQKKVVKNYLLDKLGEAEVGFLPNGTYLHRKQVNREGYTVDPYSFFDLRIKKGEMEQ